MRVFILLHKDQDDYSSLGPDVEKIFIFDRIGNPSPELAHEAMTKLVVMLGSVTSSDRIIFNGPSWLIALAGWVWMNDENRLCTGILAYDNYKKTYIEVNNAY